RTNISRATLNAWVTSAKTKTNVDAPTDSKSGRSIFDFLRNIKILAVNSIVASTRLAFGIDSSPPLTDYYSSPIFGKTKSDLQ
ncbi:hypothetical protein HAX54_040402, partial [Datura stramonium]|nr:hypothetical protein [Datura stramonium]